MIERLGNVLYWLGWILAGLSAVCGLGLALSNLNRLGDALGMFVMGLVVGLIFWSVGWAIRYVLTGKQRI